MTDESASQLWLSGVTLVWNVLLGIYVRYVNREKATRGEIKAVSDSVQALKDAQAASCGLHLARTVTLETKVETAPSHNDLAAIHEKVGNVKGTVDKMDGTLTAISKQMQLLYEHHLKERAK